jgi:hypothetical protein
MNYLGTSYGVLRKENAPATPPAASATTSSSSNSPKQPRNLEAAARSRRSSPSARTASAPSTDWKDLRRAARDRAPQRIPGPPSRQAAANKTDEKIVYHDPCYLGRYRDVYDEPRAVIARSGNARRSPAQPRTQLLLRSRRRPRLPRRRNRRARQPRPRQGARRHRSHTIGTACPFCNTMFRDALAAVGRRPAALLDIAQSPRCNCRAIATAVPLHASAPPRILNNTEAP